MATDKKIHINSFESIDKVTVFQILKTITRLHYDTEETIIKITCFSYRLQKRL